MSSLFRLIICLWIAIFLSACTTLGKQVLEEDIASSHKYAAWQPDNSQEFEAISTLIIEADNLIEANSLNAAEDKLERALRIKANYAPAWSRLSWMALQTNSPKRAVQMAKRSNSFAYNNRALQSLNWSFIKDASQALNNLDEYLRAAKKIDSLQSF